MSETLCSNCVAFKVCQLESDADQAIVDGRAGDRHFPGFVNRICDTVIERDCLYATIIYERVNEARSLYQDATSAAGVSNSKDQANTM